MVIHVTFFSDGLATVTNHDATKMPEGFYMSICQNLTTDCQRSTYRGYRRDDHGALFVHLTEVTLTGVFGYVFKHTAEGLTLIIGTVGIADEVEKHLLLFEHDLLNTQLFAIDSEGNDVDEFLCHLRNSAKAVNQSFAIGFEVIVEVLTVG